MMNRQEQLAFCKTCKNQKFDMQQGLICSLTNAIADFDPSCATYEEDKALKQKEEALSATRITHINEASKGKRLANLLIDYIFIMVLSFVVGIVLALVSPEMIDALDQGNKLLDYAFGFVVSIMYYTLFEMITARTMGKLITGTKVVDEQGNIPGAGIIFIRNLCRYIPFEAFSFLGDGAAGWHDTLSKTRVVEA